MDESKPICDWKLDKNGYASIKDSVEPSGGCRLPTGFRGWIAQETLVDKYGHETDGDNPKDYQCNHVDTPEYKAAHVKKVKLKKASKPVQPREIQMTEPKPPELPIPTGITHPIVSATPDIPQPPKGFNNAAIFVVSAILVVVIVIAAYFSKNSKKKSSSTSNDNHGQCKIDIDKMKSDVSKLEVKIEQISKELQSKLEGMNKIGDPTSSFSRDDAEEIFGDFEKRIKRLEKARDVKKGIDTKLY